MFAPRAPLNLINYKDLRAQGIHLTIVLVKGDEAIKFKYRGETLALAKVGTNGLYNIKISCPQGFAFAVSRYLHPPSS